MAAYARWCETRHRYPVIAARIAAIARVHLLKCANVPDRHPTVIGTLKLIEARALARPSRAALFVADAAEADGSGEAAAKVDGKGKNKVEPGEGTRPGKSRRRALTMRQAPPLVARRPPRQ